MDIKVLSAELVNGLKKVEFESHIGIGFGYWHGQLPTISSTVDIEIDITDVLKWGIDIYKTNKRECMIMSNDNLFCFVAKVITIDNQSCIEVNLGGSIVLLDVSDAIINVEDWVECKTRSVKLYPTNI